MTIDEKLQHFYEISVEEAKESAAKEISEHRKKLQEMLDSHKKSQSRSAQDTIKAETESARREINMALSAEQLTLKRDLTKKQNELKEKLFTEIKKRLEAFMASPQYEEYLCSKIKEAKEFAGNDEIFIYLSSNDSAKIPSLSQKAGFGLIASDEFFIGGIKATIPSKNILIDNSFDEKFNTLRREFKFDGGFKHE